MLWSISLPSLRFVEAAAVTSLNDTLSDASSAASANHVIEYVATSGVADTESITVTFDSAFDTSLLGEEDVDLYEGVVDQGVGVHWTLSTTSNSITLTASGGSIAAGAITTIQIGTNATGGDTQIVNPTVSSPTSYKVSISSGATPGVGITEIVIVPKKMTGAAVDTTFTFSVSGISAGTAVGSTYLTGGDTSSSIIPFGELKADAASTAAQQLAVNTNVMNGFSVAVQVDQQLSSVSSGADIDGFVGGSFTSTPITWASPQQIVGSENTYGHWGISSDDTTDMPLNYANGANFVSASTSPVTVFNQVNHVAGERVSQGTSTVIYRAEISALQETKSDYTAQVTYVAIPIF